MAALQLTYMTKRGAGICVSIKNPSDAETKLKRLRVQARLQDGDNVVGEVTACRSECDNPNQCNGWHWWFDEDWVRRATQKCDQK